MSYNCLLIESGCTGFLIVVEGKTKVRFVTCFFSFLFFWGGCGCNLMCLM